MIIIEQQLTQFSWIKNKKKFLNLLETDADRIDLIRLQLEGCN